MLVPIKGQVGTVALALALVALVVGTVALAGTVAGLAGVGVARGVEVAGLVGGIGVVASVVVAGTGTVVGKIAGALTLFFCYIGWLTLISHKLRSKSSCQGSLEEKIVSSFLLFRKRCND